MFVPDRHGRKPKEGPMRVVSVQHRVKRTKDNESHPTILFIKTDQNEVSSYPLADETAELDWLKGQYPTSFRLLEPGEKYDDIPEHHLTYKGGEVNKIPETYDGLSPNDTVIMILGGSGDRFAAALAKRGEKLDAKVLRATPDKLKCFREAQNNGKGKLADSELLVELFEAHKEYFVEFTARDKNILAVKAAFRSREEALKAKVSCETNIFQNLIGKIFLNDEGYYPEGTIDQFFKDAKANDDVLISLESIVSRCDKTLEKAVKNCPVWKIFEEIKGVGPRIAGGIIAAVGDIKRFPTESKFKKFCGLHVGDEGKFPRKRTGSRIDWNPGARQAFYLLAEQFNRRPDSEWGKVLLEYKAKLHEKYPEPIEVPASSGNGTVKKYTKGHIHKMAMWKTLTKFSEWLYYQWQEI